MGGNILSFLRKGEKAYGNATAWGLWASGRRPPFQILYSDDIFMFLGRVLITEKKQDLEDLFWAQADADGTSGIK